MASPLGSLSAYLCEQRVIPTEEKTRNDAGHVSLSLGKTPYGTCQSVYYHWHPVKMEENARDSCKSLIHLLASLLAQSSRCMVLDRLTVSYLWICMDRSCNRWVGMRLVFLLKMQPFCTVFDLPSGLDKIFKPWKPKWNPSHWTLTGPM